MIHAHTVFSTRDTAPADQAPADAPHSAELPLSVSDPFPIRDGGQGELPAGASAAVGDALPGLGHGGSVQAVLECRIEQIRKWGHTPEKDRAQPIAAFLNHMLHEVHCYTVAAQDDQRVRAGLPQIRKRLVRLAALALAIVDRIDAEPAE